MRWSGAQLLLVFDSISIIEEEEEEEEEDFFSN